MESKRLKLPTGIQTFEKLREDNCVYVDKTKYLVKLIDDGSVYFLSRPRRFGKSLTISTFDALFSGKKELFKGLYAEEFLNRAEFKSHPVIRLDMSNISTCYGFDEIESSLRFNTLSVAKRIDVDISENIQSNEMFAQLIVNAARKYDSKVVLLIDEYDKPFTDFIDDPVMAEKVRHLLRNYYSRIKANDEHIRFIFITGISKYTKMGIFSTLNNLIDISPLEQYGEICGYSENEITKYFPEYLDDTAQKFGITTGELVEKMRYYYNGFCFDVGGKHRLYNPFSTLSFFFGKVFFNFWIESGTSSMFVKYLKKNKLTVEQFRNYPVSDDFLYHSTEIEKAKPESFLFQTGYLSLREESDNNLVLDYPNTEVLNALSKIVSENILEDRNEDFTYCRIDLLTGLTTIDCDLVVTVFNRLLASIPYDDFTNAGKQSVRFNRYQFSVQEWLYRSAILAFLRGSGVVVNAEMHTNKGRADLVVTHKGSIWIIEIKVAYQGESPAKKAKEAFQQIIDNQYAKPYPNAVCVGIAIDDSVRQITDWVTE
jgi:hypothetical protein